MAIKKKNKYYKVETKDGHALGYTSNKHAFQRNSGWKMSQLKFKTLYK
jgi:hypothetical protein